MAELTPKQEKYIQELLRNGGNQRQAYKAAYNAGGMQDSTIDSKASRLMRGKVGARYRELAQASKDKAKEMTREATQDAVDDAARAKAFLLEVLSDIASGRKGDSVEVTDGDGVVIKREKRTKASDMLAAALKYAEFYGVAPDIQQSQEVIIKYADEVSEYGS